MFSFLNPTPATVEELSNKLAAEPITGDDWEIIAEDKKENTSHKELTEAPPLNQLSGQSVVEPTRTDAEGWEDGEEEYDLEATGRDDLADAPILTPALILPAVPAPILPAVIAPVEHKESTLAAKEADELFAAEIAKIDQMKEDELQKRYDEAEALLLLAKKTNLKEQLYTIRDFDMSKEILTQYPADFGLDTESKPNRLALSTGFLVNAKNDSSKQIISSLLNYKPRRTEKLNPEHHLKIQEIILAKQAALASSLLTDPDTEIDMGMFPFFNSKGSSSAIEPKQAALKPLRPYKI